MKLSLILFVLLHSAFVISAFGQVPQLLSYQGRVAVGTVNFDGSGSFKFALVNAAGTTTYWSNDGTSVNGSQPTAAVALTVTKGLYSVLLGDTSLANMTAIPVSVWANADVRLRVWFDDGTNGSQLLTPDQRLAPNGYLPDGTVFSNALAANAVTSAKIAASAVGATQLATNAVTSGKIAANAVTASGIADGTITAADLNTGSVGLWSVNGAHVYRPSGNVGIGVAVPNYPLTVRGIDVGGGVSDAIGIQDPAGTTKWHLNLDSGALNFVETGVASNRLYLKPGGNVGIGTSSPEHPLSFGATLGDKISLYPGASGTSYGIGVQGFLLQIHTVAAADSIAFGYGSSSAFTETMRIKGNGNVGIGTTNPTAKLEVAGIFKADGMRIETPTVGTAKNVIGGASGNSVGAGTEGAVIAGGGGGFGINTIGTNADGSVIGGGEDNIIANDASTSTIAGGLGNSIGASSVDSAIGGGQGNSILAPASVIPGGANNGIGAGATYAFAAGQRAKANHVGAFVWADSTNANFASTANNQFLIRASGGVGIGTTSPQGLLQVNEGSMRFSRANQGDYKTDVGQGIYGQDANAFVINARGNNDVFGWVRVTTNNNFSSGVKLDSGATSWTSGSDRNIKKNFRPVDGDEVLRKLSVIPLQYWNYQWDADDAVPHIGPVAQDFIPAFYPGRDDKRISTLEFDGVELVAIQALHRRAQERAEEVKSLRVRVTELEAKLAAIEELLRTQPRPAAVVQNAK